MLTPGGPPAPPAGAQAAGGAPTQPAGAATLGQATGAAQGGSPTSAPGGGAPSAIASSPTPGALFLTVTEPADGSVVRTRNITIRGRTLPDAVVTVNGDVIDIDADGNFSQQVVLQEGPNLFDIIATDDDGNEATFELAIGYVP